MGLLARIVSARLDHQVRTSFAMVSRLVVPASVLSICVFAHVAYATGFLAFATPSARNVDFDAAIDERATGGVLGACRHVAVDGAEIVPKRILRELEIVLDLDDACWCDAVVRKIAHLDGQAATDGLAIDHVEDGYVVLRDHGTFIVFSRSGQIVLVHVIYEEDSSGTGDVARRLGES
jgi:hypothetical protein